MLKYGMKYSTIKYLQDEAKTHYRYTGNRLVYAQKLDRLLSDPTASALSIGWAAIQAASLVELVTLERIINGQR